MLKLNAMGFSLVEIVNQLTLEHSVTASALYKDWRKRKDWQEELVDIKDPEAFFLDLVANHREIYRLTVREYLQGDNSNARIGALRLLRELNKDFMEMIVTRDLQSRVEQLENTAQ
jgi:hypothetical protein